MLCCSLLPLFVAFVSVYSLILPRSARFASFDLCFCVSFASVDFCSFILLSLSLPFFCLGCSIFYSLCLMPFLRVSLLSLLWVWLLLLLLLLLNFLYDYIFFISLIYRRLSTLKFLTWFFFCFSSCLIDFACFFFFKFMMFQSIVFSKYFVLD